MYIPYILDKHNLSYFPGAKALFMTGQAHSSFLNFLNLHHILNFLAVSTPKVFPMTGCGHPSGRFRRIGLVSAVRTLEYPDFVFMLFHQSPKIRKMDKKNRNIKSRRIAVPITLTKSPYSITCGINHSKNKPIIISVPTIFLITFPTHLSSITLSATATSSINSSGM